MLFSCRLGVLIIERDRIVQKEIDFICKNTVDNEMLINNLNSTKDEYFKANPVKMHLYNNKELMINIDFF